MWCTTHETNMRPLSIRMACYGPKRIPNFESMLHTLKNISCTGKLEQSFFLLQWNGLALVKVMMFAHVEDLDFRRNNIALLWKTCCNLWTCWICATLCFPTEWNLLFSKDFLYLLKTSFKTLLHAEYWTRLCLCDFRCRFCRWFMSQLSG